MQLIYTFDIDEDIYDLDGLHYELDVAVESCMNRNDLEINVTKSTLESPDEISEHDYREGADAQ